MSLVELTAAKGFAEVRTDAHDETLGAILEGVEQAVRAHCGRDLADGFESTSRTWYPPLEMLGTSELALPETPVTAITSIHVDAVGSFTSGSFGADDLLTAGTDYALDKDDGSSSKSGIVYKLAGVLGGTISPILKTAIWPVFNPGSVQVVYTGGYVPVGSTGYNVPPLLSLAIKTVFREVWKSSSKGAPLESESILGGSFVIAEDSLQRMSDVRKWLSSFREAYV